MEINVTFFLSGGFGIICIGCRYYYGRSNIQMNHGWKRILRHSLCFVKNTQRLGQIYHHSDWSKILMYCQLSFKCNNLHTTHQWCALKFPTPFQRSREFFFPASPRWRASIRLSNPIHFVWYWADSVRNHRGFVFCSDPVGPRPFWCPFRRHPRIYFCPCTDRTQRPNVV